MGFSSFLLGNFGGISGNFSIHMFAVTKGKSWGCRCLLSPEIETIRPDECGFICDIGIRVFFYIEGYYFIVGLASNRQKEIHQTDF